MEANYKAFGGRLLVKFDCTTVKELFEQLGDIAEVLDADHACGKCMSPHIFPRVRETSGTDTNGKPGLFDYYELVCGECEARLSFGQNKDQKGLFPKRFNKDGSPMDHRGWHIYKALAAPEENGYYSSRSAPGGSPKTTPAPSGPGGGRPSAAPGYSRLDGFLRRIVDKDSAQAVIMDVYDLLVMGATQEEADAIWRAAVVKCGDPALKLDAAPNVVRELYKGIMAAEEKAFNQGKKSA